MLQSSVIGFGVSGALRVSPPQLTLNKEGLCMRVYTYARFSTDRQDEASIIDQQRVCHEFAGKRGWHIAADFADQGISGAALGNRPGVLQMLATVSAGSTLLLADLTRLCRSQDLAPLLERLRFRGVHVLGVLDGFDINSPHARMQAGLSGLMSDEMRAQLRARTHLALETRARGAKPTGGKAYGFNSAGVPIEVEAAIVREIFGRFSSGETMLQIASDLNVRAVPAPGAGWARKTRRCDARWMVSALHAMLHNDRYIGRVVWNRSTWVKDPDSGRRIRRERPEHEWVINEGPVIIERAVWDRVQARLNQRALSYDGGRGGHPRYLLSGVLQCARCGGRMVVTGRLGSHYYCGTHRHGGSAACNMAIGVRRAIAEELILEPIRDELLSPSAVDRACELIRALQSAEHIERVQAPAPEETKIEAKIAKYQSMIETDPDSATELRPVIERLHQDIARIRRNIWRSAQRSEVERELPAEQAYRRHVREISNVLSQKDARIAQSIIKDILGDVPVRPDESGRFLLAEVNLNTAPLLKVAGVARDGSGGRI